MTSKFGVEQSCINEEWETFFYLVSMVMLRMCVF